ncbi:hypothetical protein JOF48_000066 [Arthrobacter stackebrandtii]|uniref:Lytic transglycosylase domain-containing protein n=1 Tax=Arthrobacter stackebrandtii TaxID=272161 RepID=A0ABS4YS93_9MICC|nr:lytic transglycosylase domain-containing protein [Arthrobacter stackebrandtii]MBP2411267.1 hypothetical protein [Arthrobacter stackebrandtii]PYH00101.1 transglycosylase [Arthrobacter stackebrandtii]
MTSGTPWLRRTLAASAAAGVFLACTLLAAPAHAQDEPPSGYPSWSEVEKTKGDAAAAARQLGTIAALLDSLDSQAGALGDAAVAAGADYARTVQKLDAVSADVEVLNAQAERAAGQARRYTKEAVAVAVQGYKSGSTSLGTITTIVDLESAKNLNGVDLMQKLGERSAAKAVLARESQAAATQLQKTRQAALEEQRKLTEQAAGEKDAAVAARTSLNERILAQQGQSDTLVAQLAFLKDTTIAQEREYRLGQAAQADYEAAQQAKQQAVDAARLHDAEAAAPVPEQQPFPAPAPVARPVPAPQPSPKPVPRPDPAPAPKPAPVPAPKPDPAPAPAPKPDPAPPVVEPQPPLVPDIPGGVVNDPAGAKAYAAGALGSHGWGQDQFQCLDRLWERESGWRTNATNPYSGAYGIAQAYPASQYVSAGSDWLSNYRTQVNWGLSYIGGRYGSPCAAWDHSETVGWY